MELVNNETLIAEVEQELRELQEIRDSELILGPFTRDFSVRFCWSSNAIEGNTLSLDETTALIDYDEVKAGHTYTEYKDAKNLYQAIQNMLIPFRRQDITENWIKSANGMILGEQGRYRQSDVYIGSLAEAVYYPPSFKQVPGLMQKFIEKWDHTARESDLSKILWNLAMQHVEFEQIHPFLDGNGRTGRMLLNQELLNFGLLPIAIDPGGKYRQAFQRYERQKDLSLMIRQICHAEAEAVRRMKSLNSKLENRGNL